MSGKYLRATIPMPVADNEGVRFPRSDVEWFEERLLKLGSGFRKHLRARGAWDVNGRVCREPVAVYVATIEADRLEELKALLEQAGTAFRQDAILLELTEVEKILLTGFDGHSHAGRLLGAGSSR